MPEINNKIYYLCSDFNKSAGGLKILYNHVDILNSIGYDASILHGKDNFKCTWFENNTKISSINRVSLNKNDIVVIPEIFFHLFGSNHISFRDKLRKKIGHKTDYIAAKKIIQSNCRKIIFNQNGHHTFLDYTVENSFKIEYLNKIECFFAISKHTQHYLQYSFPTVNVINTPWSINKKLFYYDPLKKEKIITYMPRKNAEHALQVIAILNARNKLGDFKIVPIEGMNENQVAETLRKSTIFLSFGYPEGLPLPPAEAMSCGNIVIGYHGGGGKEYFDPAYCYPIEMGNILAFAKEIENVVNQLEIHNKLMISKMELAAKCIAENYSKEREMFILDETWKKIICI